MHNYSLQISFGFIVPKNNVTSRSGDDFFLAIAMLNVIQILVILSLLLSETISA